MDSTGEEIVLVVQQHPSHEHPLQLLHSTNDSSITPSCRLCHRKILRTAQAYTCKERCQNNIYYHRLCVEAPPQIDLHPLHPAHPLPLIHDRQNFSCDACVEIFYPSGSSFWCQECDFDLDISCALSTLSDEGVYQCGKIPEQKTLPLHHHPLTSFTKRHDYVEDSDGYICKGSVEKDGYMCLRCPCEFIIHKECIRDLYYADGTRAPRVCHGHPLKTFVEEVTGSRTCASCGSDKSGEFICCERYQVFYHRSCFLVPEILQYPSHHPNHTLVLFLGTCTQQQCQSCSMSLEKEIYYCCISCEFFMHVGCAFKVLAYCEEGMREKIELTWHKHPLLLCHLSKYASDGCNYCGDESIGPMYLCEKKDCGFLLHKRCTEIESTITHPHHPDHPLNLCERANDYDNYCCKACGVVTDGLRFTCERCSVDLDVKCAHRFPTHKHYLHEHELLCLEIYHSFECNRCGTSNESRLFRCVACNFNLHKECMELPQVFEK